MNMRLWKSSSVSALALGALLTVAGCGSGGGETVSSQSPSSSSPSSSPSASTPSASTPSGGPEASSPGATGSTASASATAPDSAAAGSCSVADLAGSVEDNIGGGAAGSVYRTLVLTNVSAAPCTTAAGYPGVSYINAAGEPLGAPAVRTGGPVVGEPLLLEPNQSVVAELRETRAENYGADCVAETSANLVVYPPENLEYLNIAHETLACANPNVELLSIGPVEKR